MIHAIDTETTGLKHAHGDKAFMISYTDWHEEPQAVRIGKDSLTDIGLLTMNRDNEWVGHNVGFDLPFLNDWQCYPAGQLHDTMIAAHVYNNLEETKGLKALVKKYLDMSNPEEQKLEEWFQINGVAKDKRRYDQVPDEIIRPYALADVKMTLALFKFYQKQGVIDSDAYKAEMAVLPVVTRIVARGMKIDPIYAKQEFDKAVALITDLEQRALREFGVHNLASTAEIADALFTRGGLKCTTFTDKKNICLDSSALEKYDHPLARLVEEHRIITKLCGTYLEAILQKAHDGRLFNSVNQVGARTGRMSNSDPNLTNIPRPGQEGSINIRRAFVCSENCDLLLIDLSQIELRLLAHYSKEPEMIRVLHDRKGDLHAATSQVVFGLVDKKHRTVAKTLNFATIYSAGAQKLCDSLNQALPDAKFTVSQTKGFKEAYFKGFPYVRQFIWDIQNTINSRGYVVGKSGRHYHCDKEKAYRAVNFICQGEAAMLMKSMLVRADAFLKGKKTRIINVIHDEVLFDLAHDERHLIPELVNCFEVPEGWRVPIYANASITSTNWADKKDIPYEQLASYSQH